MIWQWIGLSLLAGLLALFVVTWLCLYYHIKLKIYPYLFRIFQEKPLFIIPRGQPIEDAEEVDVPAANGLTMKGLYLRSAAEQRLGVILFGLEFGSNRWASVPYCQFLRDAGFDIFTFEPRSQGDSDKEPGYEPLQWVTDHEVSDMKAALAYMRARPDADPQGVGFFGISKGGGAGLMAAANDNFVRCFVTDGIFATHTTMLPYMRKWIAIYSRRRLLQAILPDWYYRMFAKKGLRQMEKDRKCRFPHLENVMRRLSPRPLFMIHGGADTYIKPEMAQRLFERAKHPKELWLVKGAKHNQAFHIAAEEYKERVLTFFQAHLPGQSELAATHNGTLNEEAALSHLTAHQG